MFLSKKELEYLEEIINNEIVEYLDSGYSVDDDYVIDLRKLLKKLELEEIRNYDAFRNRDSDNSWTW